MADHRSDTPLGAAEAIGAALTGDAAMQTRREFRVAAFLIGLVVLVLAANGALWWPAELAIGLLVGLVATVLGILAAVVSVPLALLAAVFATVVALAVAAVVTLLALLPVLLPLALLAGFVWLVVKLASASASTVPPALPASVAGEPSS